MPIVYPPQVSRLSPGSRVLVACEFSGRVREAFRAKGHDAWSCDLLPTEIPGHHFRIDIWELLEIREWDLMIAFPPCTYLSLSSNGWHSGSKEREYALAFVRGLLNYDIPKIALENPIGVINSQIRKPDQIIQPWQFGHGETKATCLWLKGLPKLVPSNVVEGRANRVWKEPPGGQRWKNRSRTYQGIADAMAEQWG